MPVLELHTIDVAAVEPLHLCPCLDCRLVAAEGGHEAVAREACPVGADVDGDGGENLVGLLRGMVYFGQVSAEVLGRRRPRPAAGGEHRVADDVAQVTVANPRPLRRSRRQGQRGRRPRSIAATVGLRLIAQFGELGCGSRGQRRPDGPHVDRLLVGLAVQGHRAGGEGERAAIGAGIGRVLVEGKGVRLGPLRARGCADGVEPGREAAHFGQVALAVGYLYLLRVRVHLHPTRPDVVGAEFIIAAGVEGDALCARGETCAGFRRAPVVAPARGIGHELQLAAVVEESLPGVDARGLFRHGLTAPSGRYGRAHDVERSLLGQGHQHGQKAGKKGVCGSVHGMKKWSLPLQSYEIKGEVQNFARVIL